METVILKKQPFRLTDSLWLERGRVHEVLGSAAESLALSVAGAQSGPIVWIGEGKDIYSLSPSALKAFIDPTRVLLVEGTNRKERLWSAEQVLRSKGASVVIVQLSTGPDLTESRRLQLACEQGGGIGFVLISKRAQSSVTKNPSALAGAFKFLRFVVAVIVGQVKEAIRIRHIACIFFRLIAWRIFGQREGLKTCHCRWHLRLCGHAQ